MKPLIGKIRETRLKPIISAAELTCDQAKGDIPAYQLQKFNQIWSGIQRHVPFYNKLFQDGRIPATIVRWGDFERLPELNRSNMQHEITSYIDHSQPVSGWSLTGGSTGTPIRVPRWASEDEAVLTPFWRGRAPYGIDVSDRMFHFWGHSHLFGNGLKRHIAQAKRKVKNALLGYRTFSAYNLNHQRLTEAGEYILNMRPDYIVGYSRSLTLLAKVNLEKRAQFHRLGIKAVVATTEAFSEASDRVLVEDVFGCPVAMEYGAAETGVMAYTHPVDGGYRVFWDLFMLEAISVDEHRSRLLVTTLYPRAMPLIRYDIGDHVVGVKRQGMSVTGFDDVLGRDNDLIEFEPGVFVHPVALIHCVQSVPGVLGMQVVQETNGSICIRITGTPSGEESEHHIRNNLSTLHPRLGYCAIEYASGLEQTIAGKTRWVVKRS